MKVEKFKVTCELCGEHKPLYTFTHIAEMFGCLKCIKEFEKEEEG